MDPMSLSLDQLIKNKPKPAKKVAVKGKSNNGKPKVAKASRPTKNTSATPKLRQPFDEQPKKNNRGNKPLIERNSGGSGNIFDRLGNNNINKQASGTAVLIENLNRDITASDIAELCGRHGEIKKVEIQYNARGQSVGKAEVLFAKQSSALDCVKKLNGVTLDGTPMSVKLAGRGNKEHPLNPTPEANVRVGLFGTNMNGGNRPNSGRIVKPFDDSRNSSNQSRSQHHVPRVNKPRVHKPRASREEAPTKSAADLDAEMDAYFANK